MEVGGSDAGRRRQIVRLRSVLCPWSSVTHSEHLRESLLSSGDDDLAHRPVGVPKGYLAVYVGRELRRVVIPMSFLCAPEFRALLARVEEEFGLEHEGGLTLPCEADEFEELVAAIARRERGRSASGKKAGFGSRRGRRSLIGLLAAVPSFFPSVRPSLATVITASE